MSTDTPRAVRKTKAEDNTLRMDIAKLKEDFTRHLRYTLAITERDTTPLVNYMAFSLAIRDRLVDAWMKTLDAYSEQNPRELYYLSLEFLIGRLLSNNVTNLGLEKICEEALKNRKFNWAATKDYEVDAGLGNGGLGRLAACFLDSLSTLDIPSMGYGLRYDYGIFKQKIVRGMQVEEPDNWLANGYPWEFKRPEHEVYVQFGGEVQVQMVDGRQEWHWIPAGRVKGIPYDVPIVGYGATSVNTLRLWSAAADNEFDLEDFNQGSYVDAVQSKVLAENLTKVLYPNDNIDQGKELRLRQQYFFVACTLQDILRRHRRRGNTIAQLPDKAFLQLNDTHPTLVIPELMRILLDEEHMEWEDAWHITTSCVGYTNHTILPEALEKWSVSLFGKLLPRHLQIIFEINGRFLQSVSTRYPNDKARLARMSIIQESPFKAVRMANLAIVGAKRVNGVAKIHSDILKKVIFKDFADIWPYKFMNVTNGITQRRWLLNSNPRLAALITSKIGPAWITNLYKLSDLLEYQDDEEFMQEFHAIKEENKVKLAKVILETTGVEVDPKSIFDVQIKRLHEYKRQLLLTLYIIMLYNRLIENPDYDMYPHTFIFSGKSAPGYATAKLIIRLIHSVAEAVNTHPTVSQKLKVVFLPDYRVSLAEQIIPAANVSEQISLAGTEASGTGNMKLMLNGALTLGTMDGANVEIHDAVGDDNIFIFGLRAEEVAAKRPSYNPKDIYYADAEIKKVIDTISNNVFSILEPGLYAPLVRNLIDFGDYYMLLADLRSYADAQEKVDALYRDQKTWDKKALTNVAFSGKFSSDRTIREYCDLIWNVVPWR
ncbi:MAG: glycogen/starch/alpha-glucan phosphorylase [Victivallales bacterium]|nr:glycogen/starch/alpha-glucan phosphorylase [Victivallales bacterium]